MSNGKQKTRKKNVNPFNNTCHICMSRLIMEDGKQKCSSEMLYIWEKDLKYYSNISKDEDKRIYLEKFECPEVFLDLYKKWKYTDKNGNRINFICDFNCIENDSTS